MVGKPGSFSGGQSLVQQNFSLIICSGVGLHSLPGSFWPEVIQVSALRSMDSMVGLMVNPKRVYTKGDLPR